MSLVNPMRSDAAGSAKGKGWSVDHYDQFWFLGGAEALSSIVNGEQETVVCLPAFFCGQSLRFIRNKRVQLCFYPLKNDLRPDYGQLEALIKGRRVDFLLYVHYFGRIQGQQKIDQFCKQHDISLIEDCAHVIHPSVHNSWVGDFLVFAPHKFFSVAHGGVLYRREGEIRPVKRSGKAEQFPWLWYLKGIAKRSIPRKRKDVSGEVVWSSHRADPGYFEPSFYEHSLLDDEVGKLNEKIEKRRLNRRQLSHLLSEYDRWRALVIFSEDEIPYLYGMLCDSTDVADQRFQQLRNFGVPVMKWPDLPGEIRGVVERDYPADKLRTTNTLYFSLHEQLDIGRYTQMIRKALHA